MDGKARCMDNIFIERLWRSVKYEEVYLNDYATTEALRKGLRAYFYFYNTERPHQTFDGATPLEVYKASTDGPAAEEMEKNGPTTACALVDNSGCAGPTQAEAYG